MNLASYPVLVIDDFQNMRSTLRQMLLSLGARIVDFASNGEQAVERLRGQRYPIVLCDYNLGEGLDGQQLLDKGRREGFIDLAMVFIMVTAESSRDMVMGALEFAPDAYLAKPFNKELLRVRISRALARRLPLLPVATALRRAGPTEALTALQPLFADAARDTRADLLRIQADLAARAGHWELVARTCKAAMAERPIAWALTLIGWAAEQRGQPQIAETAYQQSRALMPHFMEAHDRLARLWWSQDRRDEAFAMLAAAARLSPKSLTRQRELALWAVTLGQYDIAETAARRAVALRRQMGEFPVAETALLAMALAKRGDARQALTLVEGIDRKASAENDWWVLTAHCYCEWSAPDANRRERLMHEFDRQLALTAPPPESVRLLTDALAALGESTRADAVQQSGSLEVS